MVYRHQRLDLRGHPVLLARQSSGRRSRARGIALGTAQALARSASHARRPASARSGWAPVQRAVRSARWLLLVEARPIPSARTSSSERIPCVHRSVRRGGTWRHGDAGRPWTPGWPAAQVRGRAACRRTAARLRWLCQGSTQVDGHGSIGRASAHRLCVQPRRASEPPRTVCGQGPGQQMRGHVIGVGVFGGELAAPPRDAGPGAGRRDRPIDRRPYQWMGELTAAARDEVHVGQHQRVERPRRLLGSRPASAAARPSAASAPRTATAHARAAPRPAARRRTRLSTRALTLGSGASSPRRAAAELHRSRDPRPLHASAAAHEGSNGLPAVASWQARQNAGAASGDQMRGRPCRPRLRRQCNRTQDRHGRIREHHIERLAAALSSGRSSRAARRRAAPPAGASRRTPTAATARQPSEGRRRRPATAPSPPARQRASTTHARARTGGPRESPPAAGRSMPNTGVARPAAPSNKRSRPASSGTLRTQRSRS